MVTCRLAVGHLHPLSIVMYGKPHVSQIWTEAIQSLSGLLCLLPISWHNLLHTLHTLIDQWDSRYYSSYIKTRTREGITTQLFPLNLITLEIASGRASERIDRASTGLGTASEVSTVDLPRPQDERRLSGGAAEGTNGVWRRRSPLAAAAAERGTDGGADDAHAQLQSPPAARPCTASTVDLHR